MDVKTLCLGVLTLRDMTGYEIKKHFEQSFAHFFVAGYGSIYPALSDLTRMGLVNCQDVTQAKRPDKKVYSITDAGRVQLAEALADAIGDVLPIADDKTGPGDDSRAPAQ